MCFENGDISDICSLTADWQTDNEYWKLISIQLAYLNIYGYTFSSNYKWYHVNILDLMILETNKISRFINVY